MSKRHEETESKGNVTYKETWVAINDHIMIPAVGRDDFLEEERSMQKSSAALGRNFPPDGWRTHETSGAGDDGFPEEERQMWESWEAARSYSFDCDGIIAGNSSSIREAIDYSRKHKREPIRNSDFVTLTRNCTRFKARRG